MATLYNCAAMYTLLQSFNVNVAVVGGCGGDGDIPLKQRWLTDAAAVTVGWPAKNVRRRETEGERDQRERERIRSYIENEIGGEGQFIPDP